MRLPLILLPFFISVNTRFVKEKIVLGKFPKDFMWGVATSSYQVEGGWNADGRSPSIWDTFVRKNGVIADGLTGNDASKSYEFYQKDVDLLKSLGVKHYRFSISWSRLIPSGNGSSNPLGIQYYKNLIAALKAANIKPMVTLYHWDLPQVLEDQGGWLNPQISDWFEAYADLCFTQFGADVKHWITFNQPLSIAVDGYGSGIRAPGLKESGKKDYIALHNILRSHARAYRLYERNYKTNQTGQVGISIGVIWTEPADNSTASIEAAERLLQHTVGWIANPIWGTGDYPQVMIDRIANKSAEGGLAQSRLPSFTEKEKKELKGSADFFGLNIYTAQYVNETIYSNKLVSFATDSDVNMFQDKENWFGSASNAVRITPWAMRQMLNWIKSRYNNPPVIVTENGWGELKEDDGSSDDLILDDLMRVYYYKSYINNVLKAINDGCNVIGYTAWSLLDNFEWQHGYTVAFGLHYVNFTDPTRPRIPRNSAAYYARIIAKNGFVPEQYCDSSRTEL